MKYILRQTLLCTYFNKDSNASSSNLKNGIEEFGDIFKAKREIEIQMEYIQQSSWKVNRIANHDKGLSASIIR
jgi:hypothetical protein